VVETIVIIASSKKNTGRKHSKRPNELTGGVESFEERGGQAQERAPTRIDRLLTFLDVRLVEQVDNNRLPDGVDRVGVRIAVKQPFQDNFLGLDGQRRVIFFAKIFGILRPLREPSFCHDGFMKIKRARCFLYGQTVFSVNFARTAEPDRSVVATPHHLRSIGSSPFSDHGYDHTIRLHAHEFDILHKRIRLTICF
jgi:hypothetical protein